MVGFHNELMDSIKAEKFDPLSNCQLFIDDSVSWNELVHKYTKYNTKQLCYQYKWYGRAQM